MSAHERAERNRAIGLAMYCAGAGNSEIAEKIGVSTSTVSGWARKFGWNTAKKVVDGEMTLEAARELDQRLMENPHIQDQALALSSGFAVIRNNFDRFLIATTEHLAEVAEDDPGKGIALSRNAAQLAQVAQVVHEEFRPQKNQVQIAVHDTSKVRVRILEPHEIGDQAPMELPE